MNERVISNALSFLDRATLNGSEVMAFIEVKQMLDSLLDQEKRLEEAKDSAS